MMWADDSWEASVAEAEARREFPMFYPKIYDDVGNYTSPKRIAVSMMHLADLVQDSYPYDPNRLPAVYAVAASPVMQMVNCRMPTYFVTRDLTSTAFRTDYRDTIDIRTMKLPFEAGIFQFPRNTLVHPDHGDASWVAWGRTKKLVNYSIRNWSNRPVCTSTDTMCFFVCAERTKTWFHFCIDDLAVPGTFKLNDVVRLSHQCVPRDSRFDLPVVADDADFIDRFVRLAFNLFFIMRVRPELIRDESLRKRVVRPGQVNEFWSPRILGHNYRVRIERRAPGTEGVDRHSYWVSGHDKMQVYGPQNSLRKEIFIDPYFVDTGVA